MFLLVAFAAWLGPAIGQGEDRWTLMAGLSLLTAVWLGGLRGAWSGCGVRLTAHGIDYRGPASTLTVPWEALDAVHPVESVERFAIRLRYARPDLIRATGVAFDRRTIRFEGADAHFLAAAIDCYAAHPQRRARIGTRDALDELRRSVPPAPPQGPPPGWASIGAGVLVFVVAFAVQGAPVPRWVTWIAGGIAIMAAGHSVPAAWTRLRGKASARQDMR
ncbi:hypothetical protein [Catenuloplanes atrovinosus]|uniref:PH domain-containing protein n=1 Tax=Catenuloplanes atrovinosus TaxID=137266 RepID=A0AAE3YJ37_9ACTN|nr:hypothetical protein [Catenuloplanes atrovinosus]MDR7274714.1 hypothetical protein [Catenuloplanes atrovinosus]